MSKKNKKNRKKITIELSINVYFIRFKIIVEWL